MRIVRTVKAQALLQPSLGVADHVSVPGRGSIKVINLYAGLRVEMRFELLKLREELSVAGGEPSRTVVLVADTRVTLNHPESHEGSTST